MFSTFGQINKSTINGTFCIRTQAQVDLAINNVRARILNGGDLWWDPNDNSTGIYEVPKGSGKTCIYAGSIWIGGVDGGGQIRVAAQTYRQTGANDFWAGPISKTSTNSTGNIDTSRCNLFDRFWVINKIDVQNFVQGGSPTSDMISWPGNGDVANNELPNLAPFFDANNDGLYNYTDGDYPNFNLSNNFPINTSTNTFNCNGNLFGDQNIWWVFNDIGNIKTETNALPMGLEIRAQAYAFSSSNINLNNTTFYNYEIINRSNETYSQTYFGVWNDADLGGAADDYVGCDVGLNLGFTYNGRLTDAVYGTKPPAVGIVFLNGPLVDTLDGIDNNKNNLIDEINEDYIMSKFIYYTSINGLPIGNPTFMDDYYSYLAGEWMNNQQITYGGDGYFFNNGNTGIPCNYMYPGTSDPAFTTDWTMPIANIQPDDMRFLTSSGPFKMLPGEINYVTDAVVWAQADSGGPLASVAILKQSAIEMQQLFDKCFTTIGSYELNNENEILIYPNPFIDHFTITISGLHSNDFIFELYDDQGKIIKPNYSINGYKIFVNTSILTDGIYFVSIKLDSGKRFVKKILKM